MVAFVGVPAVVLWARGFRWHEAGRATSSRARRWLVFAVLALALFAVQALLGSQFRRLQSRLAAWTGSQVSAVLLGSLVFGLAHAPGILLRGAGAIEGLGDAPDLATTLAYVVATQGVAGIAFGVLWARTRSFVLVVALHGFTDALSNTGAFIETWLR